MSKRPRSLSQMLVPVAVVLVAGLVLGVSAASSGPSRANEPPATTWTTVLRSTLPIEGLTGDDQGFLYVAARGGAAGCPVWRVDANGGANQAPVMVGTVPAPCNPSGLTFDADGN